MLTFGFTQDTYTGLLGESLYLFDQSTNMNVIPTLDFSLFVLCHLTFRQHLFSTELRRRNCFITCACNQTYIYVLKRSCHAKFHTFIWGLSGISLHTLIKKKTLFTSYV